MRSFVVFAAGITVFSVYVIACVGDEPLPSGGASSSSGTSGGGDSGTGTGSSGGSSSSGTPACKGDTVDACGASCTKCTAPAGGSVECTAGACVGKCSGTQTVCGEACVETKTSSSHCGKCGHSCNGGSCADGLCQPVEMASGFTTVNGIVASPMGVVMMVDDKDVKRCGVPTGCTAGTLSDVSTNSSPRWFKHITIAGSEVFWDGAPSDPWIVWHCPAAGCPASGPIQVESNNDRFGALVAGPNDVYWTIAGYNAPYSHKCTPPACSSFSEVRPYVSSAPYPYDSPQTPTHEMTIPTSIVSVGATSVIWATGGLYNDSKYMRSCALAAACPTPTEIEGAGASALTYYGGKHYGAAGTTIFSIDDAAPTTARANVAPEAAGVVAMAADASGVYWVNATTGNVRRCAKLTGECAAGEVETLAVGQTGATGIAIDANNVYWAMPTKVMRVVKP